VKKSRKIAILSDAMEASVRRTVPQWLELDKSNFKATVKSNPVREDIQMPIQEQLIVELYSK
jgi:small subunit ribosomal protein S4